MSRFLLLNFEDFGLNQDITTAIQPFNPFCICCLDTEGPMLDLEKCEHSDYLDAFDKPQLKQFNQLVCLHCHCILKKIKCFREQVLESYNILLSGSFTNNTINNKKLNNLIVQKVVDDLHLPPGTETTQRENILDENITNNIIEDNYNDIELNTSNIDENFSHELPSNSNMEENFSQELPSNSNMEQNFSHVLPNNSNMGESFTQELPKDSNMEENFSQELPSNSNIEENFSHELPNDSNIEENFTPNHSNIEDNFHEIQNNSNTEQNLIQEQDSLNIEVNKNIKTALEILERNNQSFVTLGSQLQFLNGEHLSFLEPSLLSKEILTDIPLVPKSLSTDLDNALLNNSRSLEIEIDGPDKIFYDSLDLSPDLMEKASELLEINTNTPIAHTNSDRITKVIKPKKERKAPKKHTIHIQTVKLSPDELNRERVLQAQSDAYLRYKFRCETCIVGFNYKENLDDHTKRKHGPAVGEGVLCDICSQVIPTPGCVTEHNYRHYTRYECVICNRRYQTHDEAIRHSVRSQCVNGASRTTIKRPAQQMRAKLKQTHVKKDL